MKVKILCIFLIFSSCFNGDDCIIFDGGINCTVEEDIERDTTAISYQKLMDSI